MLPWASTVTAAAALAAAPGCIVGFSSRVSDVGVPRFFPVFELDDVPGALML
jgi:hypothetical protein